MGNDKSLYPDFPIRSAILTTCSVHATLVLIRETPVLSRPLTFGTTTIAFDPVVQILNYPGVLKPVGPGLMAPLGSAALDPADGTLVRSREALLFSKPLPLRTYSIMAMGVIYIRSGTIQNRTARCCKRC